MAIENLLTYTEVDPNAKLTVISSRVTLASLLRNEDAYVYKDFGADYFNGDFQIDFDIPALPTGTSGGDFLVASMANGIDDWIGLIGTSIDGLAAEIYRTAGGQIYFNIAEIKDGIEYTSSQEAGLPGYFRFKRDESVGTYGTAYLYSYTDAARTQQQALVTLPLHKKMDLRYLYAVQSRNSGSTASISGYMENLNLGLSSGGTAGAVTTQAVTAIAQTTAIANGNVTALGNPVATQHGHCYSINHLPGVSNDGSGQWGKNLLGVPTVTGEFTSSLTGLEPFTKYYVRAFISGAWGTFYGEEVEFPTLSNEPSVSIQATTDTTATTATGNGNVLALGIPAATQYGHCWDVSASPAVDDSGSSSWGKTSLGVPGATGAYTSSLTGLKQNIPYYARAYITNSLGTFYSSQQAYFTTLGGVPLVTTNEAEEVSETTALGKGSIDNDGGSDITQHGVCWGGSADPTVDLPTRNEEGVANVGDFISLMTALAPNTLYHYRAYATNSLGTGYGADKTFSTNVTGVPTVTSENPTDTQETSVTGRGTIVAIGGSAVTEHGHCWSTSPNPTTANSKTANGAAGIGAFTSAITGLTRKTAYYYRAYATNTQGTGYGNNIYFTTGVEFPVNTVTRVNGVIHRYDKRRGIYQLELSLGDVTSIFAPTQSVTPIRATVEKQLEQDSAPIIDEAIRKVLERFKRENARGKGFILLP